MSRRYTGVLFIAIAAFLYASRFFAAAIWGSGFSRWNAALFADLLSYVDHGLTTWSVVALIAGIVYLVWGEIEDLLKKTTKSTKKEPRDG